MAKTSKSARSDRQKVIDDIRKKQKRSANRQGTLIIVVCVVIALGIIGAAAYKPIKNWADNLKYSGKTVADIGQPASVCQKVITRKGSGVQNHVPQGTKVDYPDAPPAFGKHWSVPNIAPAPMDQRFYTASERPPLEVLVHNLEHGFTILWYDKTAAADSQTMDDIRAISRILDANDTNNRLSFKAVPWGITTNGQLDGNGKQFPKGEHIAFTHWKAGKTSTDSLGVWQYCSGVSGAALSEFMDKYPYTDSPEPIGGAPMS